MRIADLLLETGGGIFLVLGLLHGVYTALDLRRPRRLVPDDPAVSAAMARSHLRLAGRRTTMWQAWVGFNFSHSLGVVLFGALCIATGIAGAALPLPGFVLLAFAAIGLAYVVIGAKYWFRVPIACAAAGTALLFAAWLARVSS